MTTRHLVDPELVEALAVFPPVDRLTSDTIPAVRQQMAEFSRPLIEQTPMDGVEYSERKIPGPAGAPDVRVLVYKPSKATGALPAYLSIHGGGLILGSADMRHPASVALARDFNCVVVAVDYRLAPEAPFPAGVEDCYAALAWMHANASSLSIDPKRIAIGGESAGGGLAAALAIVARDRGKTPIAFQMLTYPMLDDRTCVANDHAFVGEFVWTNGSNMVGWRAYLGREPGSAGVSPHASPARCEDFRNLPPAFIAAGSLDLFLEEDIEYARRLWRAGVAAELHVYPGAFHGFDFVTTSAVSQTFTADWRRAFAKAMRAV